MNYDEEAKKIADDLVDPDPLSELNRRTKVAIAAALRRAANEAAWDMHRMKCDCERAATIGAFGVVEVLESEMAAKYGPQGGTR